MRNYFKALFLILFITSCSPEEVTILGILTTNVQPANTGNIARITQSNSNVVQLVAVPFENYAFKGWLEGNQATPSNTNANYFVQLDESNKLVTAVFEFIDEDNDGVTDALDLCPNTDPASEVDGNGCALEQLDTDEDGVNDRDDLCPNTILNGGDGNGIDNRVDLNGCADYQKDTDNDGVTDDMDLCPDTILFESKGEGSGKSTSSYVDKNGCADYQKDTDNDGVTDDLDLCEYTPSDEIADENGCAPSQKDTDEDGVNDRDDLCPNTILVDEKGEGSGKSTDSYVDENGCADYQKDTDGDGVTDDNDNCSETPLGEIIDVNGCSDAQEVPTTPTLTISNITETSVDLSWTESTDNFGVVGYDILINGVFNQTVIGTTASITGLTPATAYNFTVRAKDAAGSVSLVSNIVGRNYQVTVNILMDRFPGEVSWDIKNTAGDIISSAGRIYGSQYTIREEFISVVVPLVAGDYIFTMYDSFGDGIWHHSWGYGHYELKDATGAIIGSGGQYGHSESTAFTIPYASGKVSNISKVDTSAKIGGNQLPKGFNIYQGGNGEFKMTTGAKDGQSADISIYNPKGKLIIFDEDAPVENYYNLSKHESGTYIVKVTIGNEVLSKEFGIK